MIDSQTDIRRPIHLCFRFSSTMSDSVRLPSDTLLAAAYILQRCRALDVSVNVTKTNKLLYICYGVCLAKPGFRLCDENPLTGPYGPDFRRVHSFMNRMGLYALENFDTESLRNELPKDVIELLDRTIAHFGRFASNQLVNWLTKKESPWAAVSGNGQRINEQIPDRLTAQYFRSEVLR